MELHSLTQTSWGGPQYATYDARLEDAPAAASASGAPAAPAATSGPAAASSSDGTGDSSTPGSKAASPAAGQGSADSSNARQLREQYERLKGEHGQYTAHGSPQEVARARQVFTNMQTKAYEFADALGYTRESIDAALDTDPYDAVSRLQAEYAQHQRESADQSPEAIEKRVREGVRQDLLPVTDHINNQKTEVAYNRLNTAFDEAFNKDFEGAPPEFKKFMFDAVCEIFKYDTAAILQLKNEGKTDGLMKVYGQIKSQMLPALAAWSNWESSKGAGGRRSAVKKPGEPAAVFTPGKNRFDQMAEDPDIITKLAFK